MATKSFLSEADLKCAPAQLTAPGFSPSGDESRAKDLRPQDFSRWLEDRLLERLQSHPCWRSAGPIALGSWSRNELSPKSDVDLLFVGDEDAVQKLTTDFAKQGVKLRYRMPEDRNDWTVGVEPFDILALIGALPLESGPTAAHLENQQANLRAKWKSIRKDIFKAMIKEREARNVRYDSISSYLEPNLKYGSGGLRDLEQALALRTLFPERFETDDERHAFDVLDYYKKFFLLVRQKLHLQQGASDLLTAPEQAPIASWLAFKTPRDFMKEIQKGFSRVSFYADWAFEQVAASKPRLARLDSTKLETPKALFDALKEDPSVLMQNRVRQAADRVFAKARADRKSEQTALDKLVGRELTGLIDPAKPEAHLIALFRSRLIDHCVPEFKRIVGHVQHDQYHRFSVDAHILQALRELGRLRKNPKLAGRLVPQIKSLTQQEWEVLSFACLYHDIAKGREGDHSIEGIAIAECDLKKFGKSVALIKDVTWIVEEHLILSSAAFKENPASPRTWAKLAERGVSKRRIPLLAAFTIVDIRATNPDAWTAWKERLLAEVVTNLENPEATNAIEFAKQMGAQSEWVDRLDSFLVSMVSPKKLAQDLKSMIENRTATDFPPRVIQLKGQTWIRFHSAVDRPGLFASYVGSLSAVGLGIRHASIHTFNETGVYDWFEVKTEKSPAAVSRLLLLALTKNSKVRAPQKKPVLFDVISVVSEIEDEWVVSFRGKDQPGALLEAATALFEQGAEIKWARVHTWGRQIDDVFGIKPLTKSTSEVLIESLKSRSRA